MFGLIQPIGHSYGLRLHLDHVLTQVASVLDFLERVLLQRNTCCGFSMVVCGVCRLGFQESLVRDLGFTCTVDVVCLYMRLLFVFIEFFHFRTLSLLLLRRWRVIRRFQILKT